MRSRFAMKWMVVGAIACVMGPSSAGPAVAQEKASDDNSPMWTMGQVLVLPPAGESRRSAIHTDSIERLIVEGRWHTPSVGEVVVRPDGQEIQWEQRNVDSNGWLGHRGYVLWTVEVEAACVRMLEASGHSLVYVNGEPRTGDPYEYGNFSLPVALRKGTNELLFSVSRGRMRAQLTEPKGSVFFDMRDLTAPDLLRDAPNDSAVHCGIVIVNVTDEMFSGSVIAASDAGDSSFTDVGPILPFSLRKVRIDLPRPHIAESTESIQYALTLSASGAGRWVSPLDKQELTLNVRPIHDHHVRTFVSDIDGSVQLFSVRPSSTPGTDQALFLTLHGAGVHAPSQSGSYSPKDWGTVVAPTNRRKFGFDWEDWGRLDATEVLDEAMRIYKPDPNRVYLTGHSMGGHGTWQVGAQFPDRFAAIGPSAGWVSFWSYTGAGDFGESAVGKIMQRATSPSDTLALSRNYLQYGIYVLHGDADDNVPVTQARTMRRHLAGYHGDFAYYERPGAGHWWGNACVDWAPMFDFFRAHTRPDPSTVRHIEFITANPSISSRSQWAIVEQQIQSLERSRIVLNLDPTQRRMTGTTENVRRLAIDVNMLAGALPNDEENTNLNVVLDDQEIACDLGDASPGRLMFVRSDTNWQLTHDAIPPREKQPARAGPFKEAFQNNMVFVYGTQGNADENAWAMAKARYDAETFFYRGNGSVEVWPDTDVSASSLLGRNIILYGNAQTNALWSDVLSTCPIKLLNGSVEIGSRRFAGDDLACLFTFPRSDDLGSLVAVVGGTGLVGARLTDRMPYFVSGVHYPDWFIAQPTTLSDGVEGVVGAGFFDHSWQYDEDSSGWSE